MIKRLLLFLLFLAPTIQYRVELGPFSLAFMEVVVLGATAMLLAHQILSWQRLVILKEPLLYIFILMALWAVLIRPWAVDWQHGLSDIRDWAVPVLGFAALISTIRRGWRQWIMLFLALVFLNAFIGIYQHLADSFRPFITELATNKRGFLIAPEDEERLILVSFSVGFFAHPNGFAMYLFIGLMITMGWLAEKGNRVWKFMVLIPIFLALFWTYAKASLLVMGFAVALFWLQRYIKSRLLFLLILGAAAIIGLVGALIAIEYAPEAYLRTFWWRVGLWETALQVILENPTILLWGNGMDLFNERAYYVQPHQLYLYLLLDYGLIGLTLVLMMMWSLWQRGWRAWSRGLLRQEPLLTALWISLLGYFAIGLVESNLRGIEDRMIFLLAVACFVGLLRERRAARNTADSTIDRRIVSGGQQPLTRPVSV